MPFVEVRRHAERALVASAASALSPAGRAMALALLKESGPFALVVASPLNRAKETALLVGGRLDAVEPALLPDVGGAGVFGELSTLEAWGRLLDRAEGRAFAEEQLAAWAALGKRVAAREAVLAISHGGIIELPAVALARRLGKPLSGPSFGFLEGVRVAYENGLPVSLRLLRRR